MLNIAIKAARRAGRLIVQQSDRLDRLKVESKGYNDFVSEVDQAAEQEIIDTLLHAYPDHSILAEESGERAGSEYCWIIDPLDGTTNFLHGYPQYSVSIALKHKERLEQAVIFDPLRDELFTASRGCGAQLNDRRIRVSKTRNMPDALLGTGFPFKEQDRLETWINSFRRVLTGSSGVRRAGSAALDLAHVACGRLDGFWEFGLKPWDMAAGYLLVEEAGGMVSDILEPISALKTGNILAASPEIYKQMSRILKDCVSADELKKS